MKIAFNRAQIAQIANGLKKLGMSLSNAFKAAWQMAKKKTLTTLIEAIEKYCPMANVVKLAAQIASGSFVFTKLNGEIRFVENAVITFVHVGGNFAKFKETLPCGTVQDRTFKISTLNF
jgi:hypothetical protein